MKNILLIGVGGTGSNAVDILYQQIQEFGNQTDNHISAIVFDTDVGSVETIDSATVVPMADTASVGTICDRIGINYLREWFPCDESWFEDYNSVRAQELVRGASQWRKKSYLAFINLMNKPSARSAFIGALESMVANPGASNEVYVISSVAGGTGSGSFIPIALYAKRYLRKSLGKDPIVNAMLALPDIYADSQTPDNKVKIYANAYAILRELNAINLVAHNYNDDRNAEKRTPVKFRIGHPNEPNVGVLFDSEDKQFWTPEAAPFSQIFILDRIPNLKSITAHDIVMANALYTLICTDIGSAFDSEASNHAILHSQSNGSNAIYAGISTSQVRFPKDTVLDYLSRKKALTACESEWMVLHRATEQQIREKIQAAKDNNRKYVIADGEYAQMMLEALSEKEANGDILITDIVDRGTADFDKDGNKTKNNTADVYFTKIEKAISERIPSVNTYWNDTEKGDAVTKASDKATVVENARDWKDKLENYFIDCVDQIKRSSRSIAESILSFDESRTDASNSKLSLVNNLLCKNKKYIHPVAAMVQLCRLKVKLSKFLQGRGNSFVWPELGYRDVAELPQKFLEFNDDQPIEVGDEQTKKRSAYAKFSDQHKRFLSLLDEEESEAYLAKHTDARADNTCVASDVEKIFNKIYTEATTQLKFAIYSRLSKNIDLLIEKYRTFFSRFEKEKEELEEETKTILRKDAGTVDSVINVYCSVKDKEAILKEVFDHAGPESDAQVLETDDIAGRGVYKTAYSAAVAASHEDENWNEKDSKPYRSLFSDMVDSYKAYIARSDAYGKIASYNVVQAIEASCSDEKETDETLHSYFSVAQELATPSLRINTGNIKNDLVMPSNILVFMLSLETAKYIKKNADRLKLHLPANQNKESNVIFSCTEEFVRRYSGNDSVRVSIVKDMPDNVLYCTGEIMDISPLRIAKFDELGTDNTYFRNYSEAIRRSQIYHTDMWNPHLGRDLHRRGYLPYMNPQMEAYCDERMIKALLYALSHGDITYTTSGLAETNHVCSFRYLVQGGKKPIIGQDQNVVQMKNVAQLVTWLRNEDDLINEWSKGFDADIRSQLDSLPNIASDTEVPKLEAALTKSRFISSLQTLLFVDPSLKPVQDVDEDNNTITRKAGPGILELAYYVKTSEEASKDCDDAEKILKVAYDVFMQFCTFRAKPELYPERFIQVYRQQIGKLYLGLSASPLFQNETSERWKYFQQFVSWLNGAGTFLNIPLASAINEKGNVSVDVNFEYGEYPEIVQVLKSNKGKNSRNKTNVAQNNTDPIAEDEVQTSDDNTDDE